MLHAQRRTMCDFRAMGDSTYIDWIKGVLARKPEKTQKGIASALGIAHPQITMLLQGKRRLKADEVPRIAAYLEEPPPMPGIDDAELRYVPDDPPPPEFDASGRVLSSAATAYTPNLPGASPEIDVRTGAGEGVVGQMSVFALPNGMTFSGHEVLSEWVFPASFLRNELKARNGRTIVIEVQGDSMRPTLEPGDRVIVDLSQNRFGPDGAVYVIADHDGEPQVKRLQVEEDEPLRIRIASDNPAVKDRVVGPERVKVLGRVVGRVSRL
jgi:hypothetical protein